MVPRQEGRRAWQGFKSMLITGDFESHHKRGSLMLLSVVVQQLNVPRLECIFHFQCRIFCQGTKQPQGLLLLLWESGYKIVPLWKMIVCARMEHRQVTLQIPCLQYIACAGKGEVFRILFSKSCIKKSCISIENERIRTWAYLLWSHEHRKEAKLKSCLSTHAQKNTMPSLICDCEPQQHITISEKFTSK